MAWTELDTNGLLPGEPWTSAKALAVYENVDAAFSGDAGAPRLARKVSFDGSTGTTATHTIPADYLGALGLVQGNITAASGLIFELSSDGGSSYATGYTFAVAVDATVDIRFMFDFVSGVIDIFDLLSTTGGSPSASVPAGDVDRFRIRAPGGNSIRSFVELTGPRAAS